MFCETVVKAKSHRRTVFCGNPMGGAISTVFLAEHPAAADGLILLVPMFRINTSPIPLFLMSAWRSALVALGKGTSYLPGYGPYESSPFEGNSWRIASRPRCETQQHLEESSRLYRCGGAAAKCGVELLRLSRAVCSAAAQVIVPSFLIQAGKNHAVSNRAEARSARRMKDCRSLLLPAANHVVILETDEVRSTAVEAIDEFLAEIAQRPLSSSWRLLRA